MRVHAVQTGTVAIRERQRKGEGRSALRLLKTALGGAWTEPLPIWSWSSSTRRASSWSTLE
jgi:N-acyl homoserine lactone hydrolase